MKKMTGKNTLMLFLTAFIWGTAFVAQSVGMDYIGPFTFTCVLYSDLLQVTCHTKCQSTTDSTQDDILFFFFPICFFLSFCSVIFRSSSTGTLCRSSLKWCSLYPPDRGTKRCRSNRGIPDPQSGVRILCPRRLGDIRSETKYPRNSRMHSDVQRHHPRPVARK